MNISGLLLHVRDVERSVRFYKDAFALQAIHHESGAIAILTDGTIELILHRDPETWPTLLESLDSDRVRGKGIIIHLRVVDVDKWFADFTSKGYAGSAAPMTQPFGRRQSYIYDPDGYNIVVEELIEDSPRG